MDPRMIPKGAPNGEYNFGEQDGTRRANEPGVYYHPGAQKFVETFGVERPDGSVTYAKESGKIQGDAFVQLGYRPASEQELKEYAERKKESAARLAEKRKVAARSVS